VHVAGLADDNLRLTHGMRSPSACACRAVLSVHWCVNMLCVNIFTSNCPPTHLDWLMRVPTYMLLLHICCCSLVTKSVGRPGLSACSVHTTLHAHLFHPQLGPPAKSLTMHSGKRTDP
jgi:hypothetical protein